MRFNGYQQMALTEETKVDKIEILEDGQLQVRMARVIYDDGKEVSRSFHRHVMDPVLDADKLSESDARVAAVAEAVWTSEVVAEREAKLQAQVESK
jgi:hypothetical protein